MDLPPRDFPKWAEPEIFGRQSVQESGCAINFIQEIATANTENGNCPADGVG